MGSRLPMTYRGSRTIAQTFAKKARQNRRAKVTTVVTSLTYAHSLDQRKAEPNPVSCPSCGITMVLSKSRPSTITVDTWKCLRCDFEIAVRPPEPDDPKTEPSS